MNGGLKPEPQTPYDGVRRAWLFPKTLSGALDFSTKKSLKKRGFGERNLVRDWPQIVGSEMASHSFPLQLHPARANVESRLVIRVTGGMALHLQHQEPKILERLAIYYGYTVAARLVLVQG